MKVLKRIKLEKEAENPFYLDNPKLFDIYKKCLPPKESYFYFPKHDEIITINPKNPIKSIRRIFYNTKYTDYENKMLSELKQIIKNHSELKFPDYFDDYFLLMFIYGRGGDLNESYKQIIEYLNFSQSMFPFTITPKSKEIEILNKGFIYVYGRDNRFRPLIICQCKVFEKYQKIYKFEDLFPAISFMCQFVINNMLIPGQFETWNMIVNFKGVSILSLPDSITKLIDALTNYFSCRLNKTYIIGLNIFTRLIYKIAVNFIDPITASKITVLNGKEDPALFENIREDNIEQQFGGTAPNLPIDNENGYFPPRMPSAYFVKNGENRNNIFIKEEEYIRKYKNGEIPIEVVSPYVYYEIKNKEKEEKEVSNNERNDINNIQLKNSQVYKNNIKNIEAKIDINVIKKRINIENKRVNEKRKLEADKVKEFLNNDWQYDDEIIIKKYGYKTEYFKKGNFYNDLNKFGIKKQKYEKKCFHLVYNN